MKSLKLPLMLIGTLITLLMLAQPAMAHKVNIFAYAEDGKIYTESYFPDGLPVKNGTIVVFDSKGKKVHEGTTDTKGKYVFPVPVVDDLTININASMGHKNSFLLKKEEIEE